MILKSTHYKSKYWSSLSPGQFMINFNFVDIFNMNIN